MRLNTRTALFCFLLFTSAIKGQEDANSLPSAAGTGNDEAKPPAVGSPEVPQAPPVPIAKTPAEAALMALAEQKLLSEAMQRQRRYIWCQNRSVEEVLAAAMTLNMVVSQTNYDIHPMIVANGNLIAVDLRVCSQDAESYRRLLGLWSGLSKDEPYFHVPVIMEDRVKIKVEPYKADDGKTYDWKFSDEKKKFRHYLPAPHLGEAGIELEKSVGNPSPNLRSYSPILRLDQWLSRLMSSVDGGQYLRFRNLKVGETTLTDYLKTKGLDWERVKKELGSEDRAAMISRVTGKARAVSVFQGQGTRPSVGKAIVMITDDPFDEEQRAEFDPFRELLEAKTNGHEVFVTMASGWIEFTLWNGDEKLVAEAPPNLVADHTIPEPYTKRLNGCISCIRCHGPKNLWQPFTNEVAVMLGDRLRVFGDSKGGTDNASTLSKLAGLYSGDLNEVIRQSQLDASKRTFGVAKVDAAEACKAVASIYNAYEYEPINASRACKELGIDVPEDDKTGVATMRLRIPPLEANGLVLDDPIVGRFQVEYLDLELGRRTGLNNTRRQMEKVYADMMIRRISNDEKQRN